MVSEYPALLPGPNRTQQEQVTTAKDLLSSPWKLYEKLVGPARDPTWINSLPSEAAVIFFKHVLDLQAGQFKPEITGALSAAGTSKFTLEKFHDFAPGQEATLPRFPNRIRLVDEEAIGQRWGSSRLCRGGAGHGCISC